MNIEFGYLSFRFLLFAMGAKESERGSDCYVRHAGIALESPDLRTIGGDTFAWSKARSCWCIDGSTPLMANVGYFIAFFHDPRVLSFAMCIFVVIILHADLGVEVCYGERRVFREPASCFINLQLAYFLGLAQLFPLLVFVSFCETCLARQTRFLSGFMLVSAVARMTWAMCCAAYNTQHNTYNTLW